MVARIGRYRRPGPFSASTCRTPASLFVLYALTEALGLDRVDYRLVPLGSTPSG